MKKYKHIIISLVVSVLTILATIGVAGACYGGFYQPEMPQKHD